MSHVLVTAGAALCLHCLLREAVEGVPADVLGELLGVMLHAKSACWGMSSGISCELSRPGCLQSLLLLPNTKQLPLSVISRLLGLPNAA
jgi:hypothetical protein